MLVNRTNLNGVLRHGKAKIPVFVCARNFILRIRFVERNHADAVLHRAQHVAAHLKIHELSGDRVLRRGEGSLTRRVRFGKMVKIKRDRPIGLCRLNAVGGSAFPPFTRFSAIHAAPCSISGCRLIVHDRVRIVRIVVHKRIAGGRLKIAARVRDAVPVKGQTYVGIGHFELCIIAVGRSGERVIASVGSP